MDARMTVCRIIMLSVSTLVMASSTDAQAVTHETQTRSVRIPGTVEGFDLVRVPGGEVDVDGETRAVNDLWVLPHEVTWDLYDVYLYELDRPVTERGSSGVGADAVTRPSKPYVPPDRGFGHQGYPAMGMTIHAARSFCEWLNEHAGIESRLPTKAEWLHLASAEGGGVWSKENADYTTHPVKSLDANGFGLYDIRGNVAEWVDTDARRPIAMGGSYRQPEADCAATSAQQQASSWNASDPQIPKSRWWLADCSWVGFRFVVEVSDNERAPDGD